MGRPKASDTVCDFASLFAKTVTVPSKSQYDWVARTGRHSIFSLMTVVAQKVSLASQSFSRGCCPRYLPFGPPQACRSKGNQEDTNRSVQSTPCNGGGGQFITSKGASKRKNRHKPDPPKPKGPHQLWSHRRKPDHYKDPRPGGGPPPAQPGPLFHLVPGFHSCAVFGPWVTGF